jgi:hypothetical protein
MWTSSTSSLPNFFTELLPPRSWRRADAPSDTRVWLRGSSFSVAFATDYEKLYHPDRGGAPTRLPTQGCGYVGLLSASPSPTTTRNYITQILEAPIYTEKQDGLESILLLLHDRSGWRVVFFQRRLRYRLRGTISPRSSSRADAPSDTRVWLRRSSSASPSPPTTRNT